MISTFLVKVPSSKYNICSYILICFKSTSKCSMFFCLCVQKMPEYEIVEFAKTQLTLPDKIDPGDEMSWQHYLYSKLGSKKDNLVDGAKPQQIDEVVDRIVAMAKVLFGLHMVSL